MSKSVTVLVGSLRKLSFHRVIAENYPRILPDVNFIVYQDLDKIPYYNTDIQTSTGFPAEITKIAESINKSEAVIFLTPEYNYSIPAVLKNAIDWLSRLPDTPLAKKNVGIQTGSLGPIGGMRLQYQLRQILVFLDCHVINKPEVAFPSFATGVDLEKRLITNEIYEKQIKLQIDNLLQGKL